MSYRFRARWRRRRAVILAAVVIIGGLVIIWALIVPAADWLATHDVSGITGSARAPHLQTARDAARGRLLTLGAGVLAAGALWFTGRTFFLAREGQVTDRYTKAIEQLGSEKGLEVRIGGIYALERVARDSRKDHPTVMEVLVAFIRDHSSEQRPLAEPGAEPPERTTPTDVQSALTVIGRRNYEHDKQRINLPGIELPHANLSQAILPRAGLRGTHLSGAILHVALLFGADLTGADLTGADLTGAHLESTDLTGANLTGADLRGAYLDSTKLTGANLTGANLNALYYLNAPDFTGADLTDTAWPEKYSAPPGWVRDADSGRLRRASEDTGAVGERQ